MRGERLHPAAIAVYAVQALREAALPLVVILVVPLLGGGFDQGALVRGALFAVAGALAATLIGAIRWATTEYAATGETIRLRKGWLAVNEVEVPLSRVQAIV